MIGISKMASQVQPSATLAAGAKARQLRAEGINVFDYSLGEPDFNTPEHIRAAAVAAMNKGQTHYTPADGTPEAAQRLERVLWNDPATGVMRHADAGYEVARDHARAMGLNLPGLRDGGP